MKTILKTALAALALAIMAVAPAQAYPDRPVTFVVPWPPGDLEDILTRMIAERLQSEYGVPAGVVNKPGGGASVGASFVASQPADGYTVGSFVIGVPTAHIIRGNATWDRETFEPVGIFLTYPFGLVAAASAPYDDLAGLADHAKANDVTLGHFGFGLPPTMATFRAAQVLGFEFAGEAAFDELNCATLANGDADVINTTMQLVKACITSGDAKVIAAYTDQRMSLAPDSETLGEQVSGLDMTLWNGLFVRRGTPQEVKDILAEVTRAVVESDEAQALAENTGANIYWMDADASAARIDADYKAVEALIEAVSN